MLHRTAFEARRWAPGLIGWAVVALLLAACDGGTSSSDPAPLEADLEPVGFDAEDCPDGVGGMHSDWIHGFDTPEEAALEATREPEIPQGDLVLASEGPGEYVFVVVDDTGSAVAELVADKFGDDQWAVFDTVWCRWSGDGGPPPMDTVEGSGGDCLLPEPGRDFLVEQVRTEMDPALQHGPFVMASGHSGYVAAAKIVEEGGVVTDVAVWFYDEIDVWAVNDTAAAATGLPVIEADARSDEELVALIDQVEECARAAEASNP